MFLLVLYPPPYFEAEYCKLCGRRRVAVARYRMICLVLHIRCIRIRSKWQMNIINYELTGIIIVFSIFLRTASFCCHDDCALFENNYSHLILNFWWSMFDLKNLKSLKIKFKINVKNLTKRLYSALENNTQKFTAIMKNSKALPDRYSFLHCRGVQPHIPIFSATSRPNLWSGIFLKSYFRPFLGLQPLSISRLNGVKTSNGRLQPPYPSKLSRCCYYS